STPAATPSPAPRTPPFYRLHKPRALAAVVLTLLTHGCPLQAIVAAFGLDERTVAAWQHKAGQHGQRFHQLHVQQGRIDAQHVQADELWVNMAAPNLCLPLALPLPPPFC